MKKSILLLLMFSIVFTGIMPAYALESVADSFSIAPIAPNYKDKFIGIKINLDKTYANSYYLVAFYVNGVMTKLTPFDVSTQKSYDFNSTLSRVPIPEGTTPKIEKQQTAIKTYAEHKGSDGSTYYTDLTPDEIKIFVWNKNSIVPQTLCDNVLTNEVIQAANAEVVKSLKIVPEATDFIRNNHLIWEEDYIDGIADSWDTHLFPIMDYIDICAYGAIQDAENHLLTSLFAQGRYEDELRNIRNLINNAPPEQKTKISDLLSATALSDKYYNALNNAMRFLDFSLTDL